MRYADRPRPAPLFLAIALSASWCCRFWSALRFARAAADVRAYRPSCSATISPKSARSFASSVTIVSSSAHALCERSCQGVMTSLPMLIAEELDVDLVASARDPCFRTANIDTRQRTLESLRRSGAPAGSTNIPDAWKELREAGATARWLPRC